MPGSTRTEAELDRTMPARRYADKLKGREKSHVIQAIHSWIYRQPIPPAARALPEVQHVLNILNNRADG